MDIREVLALFAGVIRAGHVPQTSRSSRNIGFTSGDKREQRGQGRAAQSEEDNINVRWEASDWPYIEKKWRLKEIFVANGLKKASCQRGTEGSAAESTSGDA